MTRILPTDITSMTASQLSEAIREKRVSCVEVMQAYLERIHRYNPVYNAIVSLAGDDELLRQSKLADAELAAGNYRGWMHGIPHAVKDNSNARGLPTTHGSRLHVEAIAESDDVPIERIRAAGAIFIGKTNVPEFALGSQTYNDVFGATRNAYDPLLTAGGSSGGAATALAAQLLPVSDGTDFMGSLRNPAGFCNVVGFRPSFGRVPRTPDDLFYNQLSTNGPMGRNVEDTMRLLATMAGYDARSPLTMFAEQPGYETSNAASLDDIRIAWLGNYEGYLAIEPGILELCEQTLEDLQTEGAEVEATRLDFDMDRLWQALLTLRHWSHTARQPLLEDKRSRALLKPEMIWEIEGSLNVTASTLSVAAGVRAEWYRALLSLFQHFDVLALPTSQVFPFSLDIHWPSSINGRSMDTYHRWIEIGLAATLAGVPAVNLPAGFDAAGRPMGVQIIGPPGQDQRVLEFAMAYEAVTDHLDQHPNLIDRLDA